MGTCLELSAINSRISNSDFDPRTFGFRKLSDLVRKTDFFDLDHPTDKTMRVRIKPVAQKAKNAGKPA